MKTLVFDLNGTLAEYNNPVDQEMTGLLENLLLEHNVAIITGEDLSGVQTRVLDKITKDQKVLNNLYLLPNSGASMYQIWGKYGWVATYQAKLEKKDGFYIREVINETIEESSWIKPYKTKGKQIYVSESQVTFCALGNEASFEEEQSFDPNGSRRKVLVDGIQEKLSDFGILLTGGARIEILPNGITRKYGIDELMKNLHASKDDVVYVGDTLFREVEWKKYGSDYAAVEMGLDYVQVQNPEETKKWIKENI